MNCVHVILSTVLRISILNLNPKSNEHYIILNVILKLNTSMQVKIDFLSLTTETSYLGKVQFHDEVFCITKIE